MQSTPTFALIFLVCSVCMALTFIYAWAKNFQATRQFKHIGLSFVAVALTAEIVGLLLIRQGSDVPSIGAFLLVDSFVAIRIYAFTVVGLLLVQRLEENRLEASTLNVGMTHRPYYGVVPPSRESITFAVSAVIFMVLYSTVLFQFTDVKVGNAFREMGVVKFDITAMAIFTVAVVAFGEEIIFRLGLQNGLSYLLRSSRFGHHWAVLGTTVFWCAGHVGALEPNWVKFAQIFVFGLVLGSLNRRFGVIPCIITHVLFNVVMGLLTPKVLADALI